MDSFSYCRCELSWAGRGVRGGGVIFCSNLSQALGLIYRLLHFASNIFIRGTGGALVVRGAGHIPIVREEWREFDGSRDREIIFSENRRAVMGYWFLISSADYRPGTRGARRNNIFFP